MWSRGGSAIDLPLSLLEEIWWRPWLEWLSQRLDTSPDCHAKDYTALRRRLGVAQTKRSLCSWVLVLLDQFSILAPRLEALVRLLRLEPYPENLTKIMCFPVTRQLCLHDSNRLQSGIQLRVGNSVIQWTRYGYQAYLIESVGINQVLLWDMLLVKTFPVLTTRPTGSNSNWDSVSAIF